METATAEPEGDLEHKSNWALVCLFVMALTAGAVLSIDWLSQPDQFETKTEELCTGSNEIWFGEECLYIVDDLGFSG